MAQFPQELVDYIVDYLHDSPRDWPACALVARSWVYPTQSHIFRSVRLVSTRQRNEHLWARFEALTKASPHLIRHVRYLYGHGKHERLHTDTIFDICTFPFTHLQGASVSFSDLNPTCVFALQQLLSLPTLHRLKISCIQTDSSAFFQIWDRCSACLRHLELDCHIKSTEAFRPTQQYTSPIPLETLHIVTRTEVVHDWLTHPRSPFDVSGLRHLIFNFTGTELLFSQKFTPALRTIEALILSADVWVSSVNLGDRELDAVLSEQVDAQLASLPTPPTLELEPAEYDRMIPHMPLLRAQNLLRRMDYDEPWLRRTTTVRYTGQSPVIPVVATNSGANDKKIVWVVLCLDRTELPRLSGSSQCRGVEKGLQRRRGIFENHDLEERVGGEAGVGFERRGGQFKFELSVAGVTPRPPLLQTPALDSREASLWLPIEWLTQQRTASSPNPIETRGREQRENQEAIFKLRPGGISPIIAVAYNNLHSFVNERGLPYNIVLFGNPHVGDKISKMITIIRRFFYIFALLESLDH
ncbi:hypothetical protein B0H11DRAFT_1903059 [Mycena galericulata]|nr:hypothetical protein B0H11DRAFT_1903059 [Mycena galericulata]